MAAQQFDTDRMKGAQPRHPLDRFAQHLPDAVFHFARGLVGKGHGQHLVRAGAAGVQQMHNPRSQRLGFAGARPCQHQDRPVQRLNRAALLGVQPVQIGRRPRRYRACRKANRGVKVIRTAHICLPSGNIQKVKALFTQCSRHGKLHVCASSDKKIDGSAPPP